MNVTERENKYMNRFSEPMSDGRLTVPSDTKRYDIRAAVLLSKKLGSPLNDNEMKKFEL